MVFTEKIPSAILEVKVFTTFPLFKSISENPPMLGAYNPYLPGLYYNQITHY